MKKNGIFKGAFILSVGAFVAKILGAIYRIPLTNLIGGYGLGLYQTVFPLYTLLLDFSGAGIPNALSKLIANSKKSKLQNNAYNFLKDSIKILSFLGVLFTALMIVFSSKIAFLQGNSEARFSYITLAPSIFLVCLISCFRGYFQGQNNMKPTAISQIIEQFIKLIFGLSLCYLLIKNIPYAVAGTTLAITISELFALIYLFSKYQKQKENSKYILFYEKEYKKERIINIIKTAVPIALIGIVLPLSNVIDSFIVVNILKNYREDATSLFGLLSGGANTIIGLPVAICYGVAVATIPVLSAEKDEEKQGKQVNKSLFITFLFALPCVIAVFYFAPTIIGFLFRRLSDYEKQTCVNMVRYLSVNILLLSILQTTNSVLIAKGKLYFPLISMGVGVAIKIILSLILIRIPKFNIYGAVVSLIACYFFACLINLNKIMQLENNSLKVKNAIKANKYRKLYN